MRAYEFIVERKKKRKKPRWAAYGPGPYGGYGYYAGYSGDGGSSGGEGGGESIEHENFADSRKPGVAEKINPKTLTRGFRQEKDMGWYTLEAVGDFASRMANDPPTMEIYAMLKPEAGKRDGKQIGQLSLKIAQGMFLKDNPGAEALVAGGVDVDAAYQRKGVASAMYAFAKELGNDVIASVDQSDDAKAMWAGMKAKGVPENFADGRNPQDKGDSKRHGINTKASVSSLRKTAKQGGRKGQLAHWLANMKAGRAKKNK
jgi:hypothetical protein